MNVNVYVPDKLAERMEKAKPDLNLSRTFQDAIERELLKLKSVTAEGLERLKLEKKQSDLEWRERGKAAGMEYALHLADWDKLGQLAELAEEFEDPEYRAGTDVLRTLEETLSCWWDIEGKIHHDSIHNKPAFALGFINGTWQIYRKCQGG